MNLPGMLTVICSGCGRFFFVNYFICRSNYATMVLLRQTKYDRCSIIAEITG